jgi:hypothetical protein
MCERGFIEIRWDGALDLRLAGCGRHGGRPSREGPDLSGPRRSGVAVDVRRRIYRDSLGRRVGSAAGRVRTTRRFRRL